MERQEIYMRRQYKKSFILNLWIFITLISVSGITCVDNMLELRYDGIIWTRCFGYEAVCERFPSIGFRQCLLNCWARPHCKAVNYWTTRVMCEIIDDDTGVQMVSEAGPCANVRRDDIFGIPSVVNSSCYPQCPEYHVCDEPGVCRVQGCPKLSVQDAIVHGNVRTVGARVTIACMNGTTSVPNTTRAFCGHDGLWVMSEALSCQGYDSIGYVQVSNMKLRIVEGSVPHYVAEEDCQSTGQLLRLDTLAKLAEIQDYLTNNYNYLSSDIDLWVQGGYDGDQWTFDNGDAMPTDDNVWYEDDGTSSCVVLRADSNFIFDNRSCTDRMYYYICEIM